jgi:ribosomal protein L7/L12
MKPVAVVFQIDNGYLVVEEDTHRSVYLKDFSLNALMSDPPVDHEVEIARLVSTFPSNNKITAIKATRDYCIKNNYDAYRGLKDAKDHVERLRRDWYYG